MKKNTSVRATIQHRKLPLWFFVCYRASLYFRLLLETFIRKDFGQRYYSFTRCLKVAFALAVIPLFLWFPTLHYLSLLFWGSSSSNIDTPTNFWGDYASWYAFIAAFLICAIKRKSEAMRNSDHTLGLGRIHPLFGRIRLFGKLLNPRFVETVAEPFVTFFIGWLLYKLGQRIGTVIMVSSVFYSISYMYAYRSADEDLMDAHDAKYRGDIYRDALLGEKEKPKAEEAEDVL